MVMTLRRHNPPIWAWRLFDIYGWWSALIGLLFSYGMNMNGGEHGKRLVICLVFILFWVHTRDQFQAETCLLFVSLYRHREGGLSQTGWTWSSDGSAAPSLSVCLESEESRTEWGWGEPDGVVWCDSVAALTEGLLTPHVIHLNHFLLDLMGLDLLVCYVLVF